MKRSQRFEKIYVIFQKAKSIWNIYSHSTDSKLLELTKGPVYTMLV